jgi:hypothetical protein
MTTLTYPILENTILHCLATFTPREFFLTRKQRYQKSCRLCFQVGCDHQLNSLLSENVCGICGGPDRQCRSVNGSRRVDSGSAGDYILSGTLPAACWNIRITSRGHRGNALALRTATSRQRLLSWDRIIRQPGRYAVFNARRGASGEGAIVVSYEREDLYPDSHKEVARIEGNLAEPLELYLLYTGYETNISWSCHFRVDEQDQAQNQDHTEEQLQDQYEV